MNGGWVIFILLIFLAVIAFHFSQNLSSNEMVKRIISRQGGRNIEISSLFFNGKDGYHFNVTFTDQYDHKYDTRGWISSPDDKVFWTRSPLELITDRQLFIRKHTTSTPTKAQPIERPSLKPKDLSSKEQIISDLSSENKWLRAELANIRRKA